MRLVFDDENFGLDTNKQGQIPKKKCWYMFLSEKSEKVKYVLENAKFE